MEEEVKEKKKLSPKAKKIINIVIDVVVAIVLAFALFLAVCSISSKRKGYKQYTEIFGTAYLAVAADSMEPTFYIGDLIKIKTVSESEASKLDVDDIITFKDPFIVNGETKLNTHRIIAKGTDEDGLYFTTHGDHNPDTVTETVRPYQIIGVYKGKASGIGNVFLFMTTSTGFFVCVVLPTLLIVVYCAVNLYLVIRKEKKSQKAIADKVQEEALADERERIRQELLAEMQANNAETAQQPEQTEQQAEAETAPETVQEPEQESQPQSEEKTADEKDISSEENKTDEDKEEK